MSGTMKPHRVLTALAVVTLAVLLAGGAQAQLDPDLAITQLGTEDDDAIEPGAKLTLEAVVDNQGGDSNRFWYNFSVDGEKLGQTQEHPGMASGDPPETLTSTAKWEIEAGEHTLRANLSHDDDELKTEQNPDNNETSRTYTVGPDLRVTSLTVQPTDPIHGEQVEVNATIENAADPAHYSSDTNETIEVEFYVDGQTFTSKVNVNGLAAGETKSTDKRTWTAQEGTHDVSAEVDPGGAIAEQDPDNNDGAPVTVDVRPALADLVVGDLSFDPDPVRPDEDVTFTATVRNNGQTDAGEHEVALVVDDGTVNTTTVSGVPEGGEENASLTWQATAGVHQIEILVDEADDVDESKEDNNAWTRELPVGSDLVIRQFDVQPPDPRANDRIRFAVEIGNEGLAVEDPFEVAFDVDEERIDSVQIDELPSDGVRNITSVAWNATEGDHNVTVTLDPEDQLAEVDRRNNQHHRLLTVGEPKPDLTVLSAGLNDSLAREGDPVTVQANLENAGSRDAAAFSVAAAIDGEEIGTTRLDGLAAGDQTTIDVAEWTASSGSHELAVQVDADDEIDEASENNTLVRSFGIGADLSVLEFSLSPDEPTAGDQVTALVLVQNNGTVSAPRTNVTFLLDDEEIGKVVLDGLGPNEQGRAELTFTATRSADLVAQADADEELDEFDEDNNRASAPLDLSREGDPPDLTIRSVSVDGDPGGGEPVRFTAEIANVGEGPSSGALVDFRVDGTSIDSPVSFDGLQAGQTTRVSSAEWNGSGDGQDLEVLVDPDDRVDESDETNNTFTRAVDSGAVGLPTSPVTALVAVVAAALVAGRAHVRKRKPPKT